MFMIILPPEFTIRVFNRIWRRALLPIVRGAARQLIEWDFLNICRHLIIAPQNILPEDVLFVMNRLKQIMDIPIALLVLQNYGEILKMTLLSILTEERFERLGSRELVFSTALKIVETVPAVLTDETGQSIQIVRGRDALEELENVGDKRRMLVLILASRRRRASERAAGRGFPNFPPPEVATECIGSYLRIPTLRL